MTQPLEYLSTTGIAVPDTRERRRAFRRALTFGVWAVFVGLHHFWECAFVFYALAPQGWGFYRPLLRFVGALLLAVLGVIAIVGAGPLRKRNKRWAALLKVFSGIGMALVAAWILNQVRGMVTYPVEAWLTPFFIGVNVAEALVLVPAALLFRSACLVLRDP